MKFAFIAAEKAAFPVRLLCRTLQVSREQPHTQTTAQPPNQPQTPAASRTPRADAKFAELLAQAREIMADPEFMEEVMALVRLKTQLETELSGGKGGALVDILARSFGRRRKQ